MNRGLLDDGCKRSLRGCAGFYVLVIFGGFLLVDSVSRGAGRRTGIAGSCESPFGLIEHLGLSTVCATARPVGQLKESCWPSSVTNLMVLFI